MKEDEPTAGTPTTGDEPIATHTTGEKSTATPSTGDEPIATHTTGDDSTHTSEVAKFVYRKVEDTHIEKATKREILAALLTDKAVQELRYANKLTTKNQPQRTTALSKVFFGVDSKEERTTLKAVIISNYTKIDESILVANFVLQPIATTTKLHDSWLEMGCSYGISSVEMPLLSKTDRVDLIAFANWESSETANKHVEQNHLFFSVIDSAYITSAKRYGILVRHWYTRIKPITTETSTGEPKTQLRVTTTVELELERNSNITSISTAKRLLESDLLAFHLRLAGPSTTRSKLCW